MRRRGSPGSASGMAPPRARGSLFNTYLFPLPAVFLTGPALASGIASVNPVGILGGSASPPSVGWFKDAAGQL